MICKECGAGDHAACPETARQETFAGDITALGSQWCECQHQARRPSPEELRRADKAAVADDDLDEVTA